MDTVVGVGWDERSSIETRPLFVYISEELKVSYGLQIAGNGVEVWASESWGGRAFARIKRFFTSSDSARRWLEDEEQRLIRDGWIPA
jgi:hypothetical protein